MNLRRKRKRRYQYRLRLPGGRCLSYFEVGQRPFGKMRLAIYGDHRMAVHYRNEYNAMPESLYLGLKAEVWAYWGSRPLGPAPEEVCESQVEQENTR